jgi:hypothetical protein
LAAHLHYSRVIASDLRKDVALVFTEEANREEIRTGNYADRSERLRMECEGGFDAARELDRDHQFEQQRDSGDLAKPRVGGAASGLQLDFVCEYRRSLSPGIYRGAERNRGDI